MIDQPNQEELLIDKDQKPVNLGHREEAFQNLLVSEKFRELIRGLLQELLIGEKLVKERGLLQYCFRKTRLRAMNS